LHDHYITIKEALILLVLATMPAWGTGLALQVAWLRGRKISWTGNSLGIIGLLLVTLAVTLGLSWLMWARLPAWLLTVVPGVGSYLGNAFFGLLIPSIIAAMIAVFGSRALFRRLFATGAG